MDLMIPSQLSSIDYKTTLKLFDQLQQANRHQDAINLMEYKGKSLMILPKRLSTSQGWQILIIMWVTIARQKNVS